MDDLVHVGALVLQDAVDRAKHPHRQVLVALDGVQDGEKSAEQLESLGVLVQDCSALIFEF